MAGLENHPAKSSDTDGLQLSKKTGCNLQCLKSLRHYTLEYFYIALKTLHSNMEIEFHRLLQKHYRFLLPQRGEKQSLFEAAKPMWHTDSAACESAWDTSGSLRITKHPAKRVDHCTFGSLSRCLKKRDVRNLNPRALGQTENDGWEISRAGTANEVPEVVT